MNNNTFTADFQSESLRTDLSESGLWNESFTERSGVSLSFFRLGQIAGLVISLLSSPTTAIPDPWFYEMRRRDASSTVSLFKEAIGKPISRIEALRIARQILEQAEKERIEIAEFEAKRGIQWEY
ncbi:MAG: hypothetical protein JW795_24115 [Chitinivibrionales bacterium]|nr:hypothetical protein [Chitinivibrionales bacterium]